MGDFVAPPDGAVVVKDSSETWRRVIFKSEWVIDGDDVTPDAFKMSSSDQDADGQLSGRLASKITHAEIFAEYPTAPAIGEVTVAEIERIPGRDEQMLRCVDDSACAGRPKAHAYVDHSRLKPFSRGAAQSESRDAVRKGLATYASARGLIHKPLPAADE